MNLPARRAGTAGMPPSEVAVLLSFVAGYDRRTIGESDVLAWVDPARMGGWTLPWAMRAALDHLTDQPDQWLMPGHITRRINERRAWFGRTYVRPLLPVGLTDAEELAWEDQQRANHIARCMDLWARGEVTP